jgi:ATP-dependent Zn protease
VARTGDHTILLLGGVVIVLPIFFSLNSLVNSSNIKAMDFNRSRARREKDKATKVRLAMSLVAMKKKRRMVEIVQYLKDLVNFANLRRQAPERSFSLPPRGPPRNREKLC